MKMIILCVKTYQFCQVFSDVGVSDCLVTGSNEIEYRLSKPAYTQTLLSLGFVPGVLLRFSSSS